MGAQLMVQVIGNWFRAKYLRLRLLHYPFALWDYTSSHCSMLSTSCIKATVCSITGERVGLLFEPIN